MAQIKITPEELREGANVLDSVRETIGEQVTTAENKVNEVAGNWEGAAQSSFMESFTSDMLPMLKNDFPSVLEGLSAQLRGAADAIEQADEEVANAFRG